VDKGGGGGGQGEPEWVGRTPVLSPLLGFAYLLVKTHNPLRLKLSWIRRIITSITCFYTCSFLMSSAVLTWRVC
jgi:hypothetical protein